jgi:hypothetical protein
MLVAEFHGEGSGMKRKIGGAAVLVILLASLVGVLATRSSITRSIADIAGQARLAAPAAADDVEALMALVADNGLAVADRNRGVWALGQLRDARALPVLESLRVEVCRHGEDICQHELEKAIALCSGEGPNLLRIGNRPEAAGQP